MRGKALTLQQAMELLYYNADPQWTAIVDWEGQYAVRRAAKSAQTETTAPEC